MKKLHTLAAILVAALVPLALAPAAARAQQKALVYCHPDETESCANVSTALSSSGAFLSVDRAYDGANGTVDLKTVDLFQYAVVFIPSMSDDSVSTPYALLRDPAVAARLHDAVLGRSAFYSGTPDLGTANRMSKNALIVNLATWAGANYASVRGPGLVALQDNSDDQSVQYRWALGITGLQITTDVTPASYQTVRTLTAAGMTILSSGGTQLAYENMASFGFYFPSGAPGLSMDAVGQTGTNVGGQVVLVTAEGNVGGAVVKTDKNDYSPGVPVVMTGSGFGPSETVSITLHEDPLVHDDRVFTVQTDAQGAFVDSSFAPEWHDVGVRFILSAIGRSSGRQAQTTFTDASITSATITLKDPGNSCSNASNPTSFVSGTTACAVVSATASSSGPAATYSIRWYDPSNTEVYKLLPTAVAAGATATVADPRAVAAVGTWTIKVCTSTGTGCTANQTISTKTFSVTSAITATTLSASAATGTYGGTANLSATLSPAVAGKTIAFTLNGASAGSATTDAGGVATVSGASLGTIAAGTYASGVGASFAGDASYAASSGTAALTVNKATATFAVVGYTGAYDGAPHGASGTATGVNGENLSSLLSFGATYTDVPGGTANWTFAGNANYNTGGGSVTISLAKVASTVTVTCPASVPYTGSAQTPCTAAATGVGGLNQTLTVSYTSNTNAGQVTASASFAGDQNHTASANSATFTIDKASQSTPVTVAAPASMTYGQPAATLTATGGDGTGAYAFSAGASTGCSVTGSQLTVTNAAGSCAVTASRNGDANYQASAASAPASVTLNKATANVVVTGYTGTYDGAPHGATGTATGVNGEDLAALLHLGASYTDVPGGAAGWTFDGNNNYGATSGTANVALAQATSTVAVTCPASVTYTGSPLAPCSAAATGAGGLNQTLAVTYASNTNAGTASASATFAGDVNHTGNSGAATFAILKASQTTPVIVSAPASMTYGQSAATLTATGGDGTGAYAFSAGASTGCSVTGDQLVVTNASGTCAVTASRGADANYNASAASAAAPVTLHKANATVTVTGYSGTYDGAAHGASGTAVGVSGEDLVGQLHLGSTFTSVPGGTASWTFDGGNNYNDQSGTAAIVLAARAASVTPNAASKTYGTSDPALGGVLSGFVAGDNVTATYSRTAGESVASSPYTISATLAPAGVLGNYAVTYNTASFAITPAPLTVTADAKTKVYGQADPALTYQITSGALAFSDALSGAPTRAGGETVGSYPIGQGSLTAGGNYALTFVPAALAITQKPVAIGSVTASGKVYDGTTAATIATRALAAGSAVGGDDVTLAGGTAAFVDKHVGTGKTVNVTGLTLGGTTAGNYALTATTTSTTADIETRPITVTADAKTKVYGNADPALTYQLTTGTLGAGDAFTGALARAAGENVGPYAIGQGTLTVADGATPAGSDYAITYAGASLAITARPVTVTADAKSKVFGTADPALTYQITAGSLAFSDAFSGALSRVGAGTPAGENVGTYAIQQNGLTLGGNYTLTYVGANLSITLATTATAATLSPSAQQYSDLVTLGATVSNTNGSPSTPTGKVQFKIDGVNVPNGLVTLTGGTATLPNVAVTQAPGARSVTAVYVPDVANFGTSTSPAQTLAVSQEDARATYTGQTYVSTGSTTANTATVTLSATLQDITAALPATDANGGDIRNATVRFVNRDASNATLCTASGVGLVTSGDTKTGTATCNWTANIGSADAASFTVGIVVDGYYTRNSTDDNTVVTVSKTTASMITGGGFLVNSASSGLYAGQAGLKSNYGFNVKYNKQLTNLQGNMNVIVRSGGRTYQIKANSMTSLATAPTSAGGTASFAGKASIQDITDPLNVIAVDGNATLQVSMTDNGTPGTTDGIAIAVFNKSGGLWFSSKWSGTKTVEQTIAGGDLVVR